MATAVPRWHGLRSALVDPPPAAVVNHALTHTHLPSPPPSRDHIFTRELAGKQTSIGEAYGWLLMGHLSWASGGTTSAQRFDCRSSHHLVVIKPEFFLF